MISIIFPNNIAINKPTFIFECARNEMTFTVKEVEVSKYSQIFWKCPKYYTEDDGKMNKPYVDWLLEHVDRWETQEDMYKMSREDPLRALKFSFDPYNLSGCMFTGAKTGGDKGNQIMKTTIKFWVENLLK